MWTKQGLKTGHGCRLLPNQRTLDTPQQRHRTQAAGGSFFYPSHTYHLPDSSSTVPILFRGTCIQNDFVHHSYTPHTLPRIQIQILPILFREACVQSDFVHYSYTPHTLPRNQIQRLLGTHSFSRNMRWERLCFRVVLWPALYIKAFCRTSLSSGAQGGGSRTILSPPGWDFLLSLICRLHYKLLKMFSFMQ
jgi:hypothetical protein